MQPGNAFGHGQRCSVFDKKSLFIVWHVSGGRLSVTEVNDDGLSDISFRIIVESPSFNHITYRGYDALTVTSDGYDVYYIGSHQTLYHYTLDLVESGDSPEYVAGGINHVLRSYDDQIYAVYWDEQNGTSADLYLVDSSGNLHHVISNVYDWVFTKSNCYVWVYSDSYDRIDLYTLNGDSVSLLIRDSWVNYDTVYRQTAGSFIGY